MECAVLGPSVLERDLAGKCEAWTQYRFLRLLLSAGLTHHPSYTAQSLPEGTESNRLRRKTVMGRLAGGASYQLPQSWCVPFWPWKSTGWQILEKSRVWASSDLGAGTWAKQGCGLFSY